MLQEVVKEEENEEGNGGASNSASSNTERSGTPFVPPTSITEHPWVYAYGPQSRKPYVNPGKWMLFVSRYERFSCAPMALLDYMWRQIEGMVACREVHSAKCSTYFDNPNADDESDEGVILCYTVDCEVCYRV